MLAESVFSTLPFTERGQPMIINGDPKGKNILYCNGKTVVIRDIEVRKPKVDQCSKPSLAAG